METDMAEERPTDQVSGADDAALFQEITAPGATADSPEPDTPSPPEQPSQPPPPQQPGQPQSAGQPPQPDGNIPSARLREEADARRNAERRADQLQAQVEALMQRLQPVQQQQPKPRTDIFDNPSTFVQEEVNPLLDPLNQQLTQLREFYSRKDAVREFGLEKVNEAFSAIESGLRNRDPEVGATYQRIMRSMDPYGDLVRWHQQKAAYAQIGGDLNAYNQRIIQQAMTDPSMQAAWLAATRGQAPPVASPAREQPRASNGQFASPQSLPSIARVGSTALSPDMQQQQDDISDSQLFAETTSRSAKRPPR
jgi:hypothetical protein